MPNREMSVSSGDADFEGQQLDQNPIILAREKRWDSLDVKEHGAVGFSQYN